MDLGVTMGAEVLQDKVEDGLEGGRRQAVWNTRRLPKLLTPGWTNRLFVASGGLWRGHFPLSGDVLWNPEDEEAPYGLIIDPRRWTPTAPAVAPRFRGWRYLDQAPGTGGKEDARGARPIPAPTSPPAGRTSSSSP